MHSAFRKYRASVLAIALTGATWAYALPAIQPVQQDPQTAPAPDNSGANKAQGSTAEQQGRSPEDRELTRKIRKSIMQDDSLSTYAKNIKIIVRSGAVTLKGPVRSDDEKQKIAGLAAQAAGGADKVTNELTVQPS